MREENGIHPSTCPSPNLLSSHPEDPLLSLQLLCLQLALPWKASLPPLARTNVWPWKRLPQMGNQNWDIWELPQIKENLDSTLHFSRTKEKKIASPANIHTTLLFPVFNQLNLFSFQCLNPPPQAAMENHLSFHLWTKEFVVKKNHDFNSCLKEREFPRLLEGQEKRCLQMQWQQAMGIKTVRGLVFAKRKH